MIISASRRTDIPAFFANWFMERLNEGFVSVANPMNPKQISNISLAPADVDCFVFWTKNPKNIIPNLDNLDSLGYRYYFQFSLNPYRKDMEPGLPEKDELAETFMNLSERIGKEKIIWRYDPVIVNETYSIEFHEAAFNDFCSRLKDHCTHCVISFVDRYSFLKETFSRFGINILSSAEVKTLAQIFSSIAKKHGISLSACAEKLSLEEYGILPNRCIDADLINSLFNISLNHKKDPAQRKECACSMSRDIGTYNTCKHQCIYCYARR